MAAPLNKLNGWIQDYKRNDNTSGVTGVIRWHGRWYGGIQYKNKKYFKLFRTKADAIKYRLEMERELFGDNAPQGYLFNEYLD